MIGGKKVLALIPARAGSKGLPDKNIRPLMGKPLLAWPIEAARDVAEIRISADKAGQRARRLDNFDFEDGRGEKIVPMPQNS